MSSRILVDNELFLGRSDEQMRFQMLLEDILNTSHQGVLSRLSPTTPEWSSIALLHGEGGMGKTSLCKRLRDIATGLPPDQQFRNKFRVLWVDWEVHRDRDIRLASHDAVSFETVLDHLSSSFREAGFPRELDGWQQERLRLAKLEDKMNRLLMSHPESSHAEDPDRYAALRRLGGVGLANLVRGALPVVGTFLPQAQLADAADALLKSGSVGVVQLRTLADEWLHRHLKADEYYLFRFPRESLAQAFAQGLHMASQRKPLLIFLDTYEIVDQADRWLRLLMQQSGSRVVWLLSGRDNLAETRRKGRTYFLGYQGEVPSGRLRIFPMSEFSQADVIAYFAEKAPAYPLTPEQAAAIQQATYGIPLAVKAAAAIWAKGVSLEAITGGFPERTDRETIISQMTDRFLVHARAESEHPEDVFHLYTLALMQQPDYELLAALWGVVDVHPFLEELERRYDFVFANKMRLHDVVRNFLREYLLAEVERWRPELQAAHQRAIALLIQHMSDMHQRLHTLETRFKDERWKTAVLVLVWHRFWLGEAPGWVSFQATYPGSLAYDRQFADVLLHLAEFFERTWTQENSQRLKMLRDILAADATAVDESTLLNVLNQPSQIEDIQPDQGCAAEQSSILGWLQGRAANHEKREVGALTAWVKSVRLLPKHAQSLRKLLRSDINKLGQVLELERLKEAIGIFQPVSKFNREAGYFWHMLGHAYKNQGRQEEALVAFQRSIDLDPTNAHHLACLSGFYVQLNRSEEASDVLLKVGKLDPDTKTAPYWHMLGHVYENNSRPEEAKEAFQHGIDLDPQNGDYRFCLAAFFLDQNQIEEADAAYRRATELDPTKHDIWLGLGLLRKEQGQPEKAVAAIKQAAKFDPTSANAWVTLGELYKDLERNEEAIATFEQASRIDPTRADVWFWLGSLYRQQRRDDEAMTALERASKLNPTSPEIWVELGELYIAQERPKEAIVAFQQAAENPPPYEGATAALWLKVAMLSDEQKQLEQATTAYERAIKLDYSTSSAIWHRLGHAYWNQGQREKAIEAFQQSISLNSTVSDYWFCLGVLCYGEDQLEKAIAAFSKVIELSNPQKTSVYGLLGHCYFKENQLEKALVAYSKAVELGSEEDFVYIRLGYCYYKENQLKKAIAAFSKAIELTPQNGLAFEMLGNCYLKQGQLVKAANLLQKRLELSTEATLKVSIALGIIAWRQGDQTLAQQYFEQALTRWEKEWNQGKQSWADLLESKALALLCLGQKEAAIANLQEALDQRLPDDIMKYAHFYRLLKSSPEVPSGLAEARRMVLKAANQAGTKTPTRKE